MSVPSSGNSMSSYSTKSNDMEICLPQTCVFFVDILFGKWAAFAHKVIPDAALTSRHVCFIPIALSYMLILDI